MDDRALPPRCRNCEAPLTGRYCAACGQEAVRDLTFRGVIGEAIESVVDLDSRLWTTLRVLVARPGRLSEEYRVGRRVRYVAPVRLYLVASVLFFAALELAPVPPIARITADADAGVPELSPSERRGLTARMERAAQDPDRLNRTFLRGLGWAMFLLIPVFGLFLRLAWLHRRDLLYVHHFVFALHVHAFAFLLLAIALALMHATLLAGEAAAMASVILAGAVNAGYLIVAARRFYDGGIAGVLARLAAVGVAYVATIMLTNLLLLVLVLLLF